MSHKSVIKYNRALFLSNGQDELLGVIKEFLPTIAYSFVPMGLFGFFANNYKSEGQIKMTIRCSVSVAVINLVLTLFFVSFLDMGIVSFSWATIISFLLGTVYFLSVMKSKSLFRFTGVKNDFWKILRLNMKKGLPLMTRNLLYILFILLSNLVVVRSTDCNGSVVWGIANSFIIFSNILFAMISDSTNTLTMETSSTKDYKGSKLIIRKHRRILYILSLLLFTLVELFPDYVMKMFVESNMIDSISLTRLRLSAFLILVMTIVLFELTNYYVLKKDKKYFLSMSLAYGAPVLTSFIFSQINPELVWWGFLVSTIFCIIGTGFIMKDTNKCINELDKNSVTMDMAVIYDMSAIEPSLNSMKSFLSEHETNGKTICEMEHCVEELSYNIIKHVPASLKEKSFNIRAVKVKDDIIVLFKYGGKPFNPVIPFIDTAEEATLKGLKPQIALRMFNHYAKSPWYHYGYGINTLSMTISVDEG